jgi:hypothetical protein
MRHLDILELKIKNRIRELIGELGLMSTDYPKVAELFNPGAINHLKRTTNQPRYRLLANSGR